MSSIAIWTRVDFYGQELWQREDEAKLGDFWLVTDWGWLQENKWNPPIEAHQRTNQASSWWSMGWRMSSHLNFIVWVFASYSWENKAKCHHSVGARYCSRILIK